MRCVFRVASTAICGADLHIHNGYFPQLRNQVLGQRARHQCVTRALATQSWSSSSSPMSSSSFSSRALASLLPRAPEADPPMSSMSSSSRASRFTHRAGALVLGLFGATGHPRNAHATQIRGITGFKPAGRPIQRVAMLCTRSLSQGRNQPAFQGGERTRRRPKPKPKR